MSNKKTFEKIWDKFVSAVKAKMLLRSGKEIMSFNVARAILHNEKENFKKEGTEYALWLKEIESEYPGCSEKIKIYVEKEVSFGKVKNKRKIPAVFFIALIFALAGFITSYHLKPDALFVALCTAVPFVFTGILLGIINRCIKRSNIKKSVDKYADQLEAYRDKISGIIESEHETKKIIS